MAVPPTVVNGLGSCCLLLLRLLDLRRLNLLFGTAVVAVVVAAAVVAGKWAPVAVGRPLLFEFGYLFSY